MARNSLVLIIRWFLVVCSFFVICLQLVHAEQYALLVGVWDYENPNLQLEAPPNDLKLMEAVLSVHGVTQGQMHILTNPDKAQIQRKFRELSRRLTPADSLLFYFSGHGTQIIDKLGTFPGDEAKGRYPDRNDEALCPWTPIWYHRRRTSWMMSSTSYSKSFRRGRFPALSTHATPATYSERFV